MDSLVLLLLVLLLVLLVLVLVLLVSLGRPTEERSVNKGTKEGEEEQQRPDLGHLGWDFLQDVRCAACWSKGIWNIRAFRGTHQAAHRVLGSALTSLSDHAWCV